MPSADISRMRPMLYINTTTRFSYVNNTTLCCRGLPCIHASTLKSLEYQFWCTDVECANNTYITCVFKSGLNYTKWQKFSLTIFFYQLWLFPKKLTANKMHKWSKIVWTSWTIKLGQSLPAEAYRVFSTQSGISVYKYLSKKAVEPSEWPDYGLQFSKTIFLAFIIFILWGNVGVLWKWNENYLPFISQILPKYWTQHVKLHIKR